MPRNEKIKTFPETKKQNNLERDIAFDYQRQPTYRESSRSLSCRPVGGPSLAFSRRDQTGWSQNAINIKVKHQWQYRIALSIVVVNPQALKLWRKRGGSKPRPQLVTCTCGTSWAWECPVPGPVPAELRCLWAVQTCWSKETQKCTCSSLYCWQQYSFHWWKDAMKKHHMQLIVSGSKFSVAVPTSESHFQLRTKLNVWQYFK